MISEKYWLHGIVGRRSLGDGVGIGYGILSLAARIQGSTTGDGSVDAFVDASSKEDPLRFKSLTISTDDTELDSSS